MTRSSDTSRKTECASFNQTPTLSTNSLPLPTDYTVEPDMAQNELNLAIDVSSCVAAKSSLNLTVKSDIAIVYVQDKNQFISRRDRARTALNMSGSQPKTRFRGDSSQSQHSAHFGHNIGSWHAHQKGTSPDSATGSCSVLMEAPPGKVLSILFLNQTCSRDNKVRVQDVHDGWSTTLNGCFPRMSPGYDVTTANRSAVVGIDLQSLTTFFKLLVQIKTVPMQIRDGIKIHYVSPFWGYIQTPGWHPFTRPFGGRTHGLVSVVMPSNHVALISVVYSHSFIQGDILLMTENHMHDIMDMKKMVSFTTKLRPVGELLANISHFTLLFNEFPGFFFYGFRMLFSIHQSFLTPKRQPNLLWNCSVSYWLDFYQHFMCNNKTECAGREDEMWCPDTSCQQGGILFHDICYVILSLPETKDTWHSANAACKQRGAALATFQTTNSWYNLAVISQERSESEALWIGLQSPDASHPFMYRRAVQWYQGSIAHYIVYNEILHSPFCVGKSRSELFTRSCKFIDAKYRMIVYRQYALCQTMPSFAVNVTQSRTAEGEVRHGSTKQIQSNFRYNYGKSYPFPSIPCPDQHRTHTFLARDTFTACCHDYYVRPSDVNDPTDNAVASICSTVAISSKSLFLCQNGASFVPFSLVCNHLQDCADNSDENFCVFSPCSAVSQFKCINGQCLLSRYYCDDVVQCVDESDETDCMSSSINGSYIVRPRPPAIADFNGRGWMVYTPLTNGYEESAVVCPDTHFFCPGDGYCLSVYVRCNGHKDCPGFEDEIGCDSNTCPGLYRCRGVLNTCLHPDHLCDGFPQCPQHDDEIFCNLTCPVHCTCLGHAFTCTGDFQAELYSRLRYLDASGFGLTPGRLVNNRLLVYLSLARCNLAQLHNLTLPNLLSLDLSDNRFKVITVAELNMMKNLQNLSLARNPLSDLFSGNYSSGFRVHEDILHVDLTSIQLEVLDVRRDFPFPALLSLNLSASGTTRLVGDGFRSLTSLRSLDLRGCPMTELPRRIFEGLKNLHTVFADNYKVCCEANLPAGFNVDNCQAPFNEISSCDALLRADVYRVCLSVLAALALCGNLGCFSLRILSLKSGGSTGYNVFVTHLCVSDFMMGVYMAMIGVADRLYMEKYLWEDGRWRHSAACQVAGVLALLSSEVSALIICLITLDRFLVIRFPFRRLRFSPVAAQIASLMTWAVGIALVITPLLPVTGYKHFYGQTGVCVPLPITRDDFAGHRYAFGVMILFNLVVFLVIASGQISVYLSMTNNAISSVDTSKKSRDLIVARRLITVVASDFLCWFPLGLLGVLAAHGVPVPSEVNVAMVIFVLPFNSALNPFLYTLNMIQEKRQRATEAELLKLIIDRGIVSN